LIAEDDATQADIAALNDFDPASDAVANVTLVATTTTNSDMRGTDGANTTTPNTVVPDNTSIAAILIDTNDLQTNQGDFATATGFSTPTNVTDAQTAIISEIDDNEAKIDTIDTIVDAIKVKTDTLVNTDLTGVALSSDIASLNDFDPSTDAVANVTLVDTTTANTDMRGTDSANTVVPNNSNIASILSDTNQLQTKVDIVDSNIDAIKTKTDTLVNTDLTGIALTTDVTGSETVISNLIAALNNISAAEVNTEVDTALSDYDGPTKAELDAAESAILSAISGSASGLTAQGIWDYLQTETTVSDSMKEAVQITLKNSKLIPAAL
jgi:hypothetical protein